MTAAATHGPYYGNAVPLKHNTISTLRGLTLEGASDGARAVLCSPPAALRVRFPQDGIRMDYEELTKRTRQGDRPAAEELAPRARERRDQKTLLTCWRVLSSARFNAWSALATSLDAKGWRGVNTPSGVTPVAHFNTTDTIRAEVIAHALVEACRTIDRIEFPIAGALTDLALRILSATDSMATRSIAADAQAFLKVVDELPFEESQDDILGELERANALLDGVTTT